MRDPGIRVLREIQDRRRQLSRHQIRQRDAFEDPAQAGPAAAFATASNALYKTAVEPAAQVVGDKPLPRTEAVSKIWTHIKKNNLQNPQNRREILADDKLEPVFGKKKVTMFEMNKLLAGHLSGLRRAGEASTNRGDARESRRIDHNHQIDLRERHPLLIHLDVFSAGQPLGVPWQW